MNKIVSEAKWARLIVIAAYQELSDASERTAFWQKRGLEGLVLAVASYALFLVA